MAPKKSNPMEEPPAASVSEEEEEETSSDEVTSDDEDGEEEDDNQEPAKPSSTPLQQKTQKQRDAKEPEIATAAPNSKSSSSEETGSDSESESEPEATPKPIATKPMEQTSKAVTSRSKPGSKRGNETEVGQKDSKRAKKKGEEPDPDEEDQKKPGEDTKKLFQRVWSEDDEIAVLEGMIEYWSRNHVDPFQDMNAFHDYIKKSLRADVSKSQLVDKVRRLKKKFENNRDKALQKGKDRIFSKEHEQKAYALSKKLWGTSGVIQSARKNKNQRGNSKSLAALKAELLNGEGDKMEADNDKQGTGVSVNAKEKDKVWFDKSLGVAGLEEFVLNDGFNLIGGVKKAELRKRWKKLQIAQLELFVQRNELIQEQAELIVDAMKSSGN